MSITLYHAPQSSASPILWILAELGVPHEVVTVDFKSGEHKQPAIMAHNPMGQVPTLVEDGHGMFESSAIMIHLGQQHGVARGLWPAPGTAEHMQALAWTAWFAVTVGSTLRIIMINKGEWMPEDTRNAKQADMGLERLAGLMKVLDERLAAQPHVVGQGFTLVDAYGCAALGWGLRVAGFDVTTTPHVAAWMQRCMGREAAKQMR